MEDRNKSFPRIPIDKLEQIRDAIKQRWGMLTDKDLDTVDGKLDQLPGILQEEYGYTRAQAGKEIKLFLSDMKAKGENVTPSSTKSDLVA